MPPPAAVLPNPLVPEEASFNRLADPQGISFNQLADPQGIAQSANGSSDGFVPSHPQPALHIGQYPTRDAASSSTSASSASALRSPPVRSQPYATKKPAQSSVHASKGEERALNLSMRTLPSVPEVWAKLQEIQFYFANVPASNAPPSSNLTPPLNSSTTYLSPPGISMLAPPPIPPAFTSPSSVPASSLFDEQRPQLAQMPFPQVHASSQPAQNPLLPDILIAPLVQHGQPPVLPIAQSSLIASQNQAILNASPAHPRPSPAQTGAQSPPAHPRTSMAQLGTQSHSQLRLHGHAQAQAMKAGFPTAHHHLHQPDLLSFSLPDPRQLSSSQPPPNWPIELQQLYLYQRVHYVSLFNQHEQLMAGMKLTAPSQPQLAIPTLQNPLTALQQNGQVRQHQMPVLTAHYPPPMMHQIATPQGTFIPHYLSNGEINPVFVAEQNRRREEQKRRDAAEKRARTAAKRHLKRDEKKKEKSAAEKLLTGQAHEQIRAAPVKPLPVDQVQQPVQAPVPHQHQIHACQSVQPLGAEIEQQLVKKAHEEIHQSTLELARRSREEEELDTDDDSPFPSPSPPRQPLDAGLSALLNIYIDEARNEAQLQPAPSPPLSDEQMEHVNVEKEAEEIEEVSIESVEEEDAQLEVVISYVDVFYGNWVGEHGSHIREDKGNYNFFSNSRSVMATSQKVVRNYAAAPFRFY